MSRVFGCPATVRGQPEPQTLFARGQRVTPRWPVRPAEVCLAEVRIAEVRPVEERSPEVCLVEACPFEVRPEEIRSDFGILLSPLVPDFYTLFKDAEMLLISHLPYP